MGKVNIAILLQSSKPSILPEEPRTYS